MSDLTSLTNHFLIAMPNLGDPNFFRSVTLVCEHSNEGAMGVVINHPVDLVLRDVLEQMNVETRAVPNLDMPVLLGGPLQNNRGFVLHEPLGDWESTLPITDTLGISTSRDILVAIGENRGPDNYLITLGYAGWAAGQLEQEIAQNAWLSGPATGEILFRTPLEARWSAAARVLGIDITQLSADAGHA
jgi:putative transcriptional regulator